MAPGRQWLVLEGRALAAHLSEAFCPALSSRGLGHSLVEVPKNQGAKTEQEWERGSDNGKGDRLGTHITLSQRGFVWAADMTAIYQVHLGPVLLTGDF